MGKVKKIGIYVLFIILVLSLNIECMGKISLGKFTKLTMENNPEIGGVAVLKIVFSPPIDVPKLNIYCFLPEPLEIVDNGGYKVTYQESFTGEVGNKVILWSGYVKGGEKKEFLLRIKVPDGRKHIVYAGGIEESDYLEIDLGEPEPPESKFQNKESISSDEEMPSIPTGIKQSIAGKISSLDLPEGTPPPLRTELRIRTKDKPYIMPSYNPQEIPLRYLIYTEEEAKEAHVTVELPEGLELINDQNYKITTDGKKMTTVTLFQGPMRLKECKAFYLKVRSDKKEHFRIRAQVKVVTYDDREFIAEDFQDIELGRVLY